MLDSRRIPFAERSAQKDVKGRILKSVCAGSAILQRFSFDDIPDAVRSACEASSVGPEKYVNLLQDVAVGPERGTVWVPGRFIFEQSTSYITYFYLCNIRDVLLPVRRSDENRPVCPFPNAQYFHALIEELLRLVQARRLFPDVKVLVPKRRFRWIDDILAFAGIHQKDICESDMPLRVKRCVLVSRPICVRKDDYLELQSFLVARLPSSVCGIHSYRVIYISRAHCANRALRREDELEKALANRGVRIVYLEELPFADQLSIVRNSDFIIAPHGAGLANLIVARKGTKVLELMSSNWVNPCYARMSYVLGLEYHCLMTQTDDEKTFSCPVEEVVEKVAALGF